jgi:hypothetical protein
MTNAIVPDCHRTQNMTTGTEPVQGYVQTVVATTGLRRQAPLVGATHTP